jgi:hypothetical protein
MAIPAGEKSNSGLCPAARSFAISERSSGLGLAGIADRHCGGARRAVVVVVKVA